MSISRKIALRRLEGLHRRVLEHLNEHIPAIIDDCPEAAPHWQKEFDAWFVQMAEMTKHVGIKTAVHWQEIIRDLRSRVAALFAAENEV